MSGTSIGRISGRRRRLAAAQRAYGALPPAQRRVLVLRYVDGLDADAVADRLGMTAPEVTELLVAARGDLLATAPAPVARPLAIAAVGAAIALTFVSPGQSPLRSPAVAAPAPGAVTHVVGGEAAPAYATPDAATGPDAVVRTVRRVVAAVPEQRVPETRTPRKPGSRCTGICLPTTPRTGDTVRVVLPELASSATGQKELVLQQEHVPLCENVPAVPSGTARCVPGSA